MLTSALVALALSAPGPRPFTVDDLVALPRVGAPDLSRDGVLVAFTVGRISTAIALAAVGDERMCAAAANHGGRVLAFPTKELGLEAEECESVLRCCARVARRAHRPRGDGDREGALTTRNRLPSDPALP